MPSDTCILTTKDFTILEVMRDRTTGEGALLSSLLRRKINSAQVVFLADVPPDVATVSSRVTYRLNDENDFTRTLSHGDLDAPQGKFLPISSLRGLALLGLTEGQEIVLTNRHGAQERVTLKTVHYQPETVRRERAGARG